MTTTCHLCDRVRTLDDDGHCHGCRTRPTARCACGAAQTYPRGVGGRITVTCENGHQIKRADA